MTDVTATGNTREPDRAGSDTAKDRWRRQHRPWWRRHRRVLLASMTVIGLMVVVAGIAGLRYMPYVDDARAAKASAGQLAASIHSIGLGLNQQDVDTLTQQVDSIDSHIKVLRDALAGDPLVGVVRNIGPVRRQIDAADETVAAGTDLVEAVRHALVICQRYVDIKAAGAAVEVSPLEGLVKLMANSTGDVTSMSEMMDDAQAHLDRVPSDAWSEILEARDLMEGPVTQYAPILKSYSEVDDVLPAILGWDGPKRYLVLAEDPAELRPHGGFAGTYGLVTLSDGELVQHEFHDIYQLDLKASLPFQQPPVGLVAHLLGTSRSWQLADSLWSPDFPTAAQDALRLYSVESGGDHVDGLLTLTTYAIDDLLKVTGPVQVPDYAVTVAPGEVTLKSLSLTRNSADPNVNRKQFLQSLATTVLDRLQSLPPAKWEQLLVQLQDIGDHRLASVSFTDANAQSMVAQSTWSGEVLQTPGDYLYVVDSNVVPASKYNVVVARSTELNVQIDKYGNALNALRLTWQNDSMKDGEPYSSLRSYSTSHAGIYGDYVRVLTPDRSRLAGVSGGSFASITGPEELDHVANRTVFANYLAVPPGSSSLSYTWVSPYPVNASQGVGTDGVGVYNLTIQKQPGMSAEPISVSISVPEGALITAASAGLTVVGDTATFNGSLTQDAELAVRYVMGN